MFTFSRSKFTQTYSENIKSVTVWTRLSINRNLLSSEKLQNVIQILYAIVENIRNSIVCHIFENGFS